MNRIAMSSALLVAALLAACSSKHDATGPAPITATAPSAVAATQDVVAVAPASAAETAAYAELQPLLQRNCLMCHAEKPPLPAYRVAPVGVVLETPEQMRRFAPRVLAVVDTVHLMPPAKLIALSDEERKQFAATVREGWPQSP